MNNKLRDPDNLTTAEYLHLMISYLVVLQDGRAKPDNKGGGYIRESVENIDEIRQVKDKINDILYINKYPKQANVIFNNNNKKESNEGRF